MFKYVLFLHYLFKDTYSAIKSKHIFYLGN